jgi:serine/threonine protein phosphatase PrpC
LVFDGVSSSRNASEAIEVFSNYVAKYEHCYLSSQTLNLGKLLFEANKHLVEKNIEDGYSTLAAALIYKAGEKQDQYVNLGDTRIYSIDKQSLDQVTLDDNPLNTPNVVTRYLGMVEFSNEDFKEKGLSNFNRLIICTDGFYKILNEELIEFHKILNFKKLGNIRNSLSRKISNNNVDDASYVVIDIHVPNRKRISN